MIILPGPILATQQGVVVTRLTVHHAGHAEAFRGAERIKVYSDIPINPGIMRVMESIEAHTIGLEMILRDRDDNNTVILLFSPDIWNVKAPSSYFIQKVNEAFSEMPEELFERLMNTTYDDGTAVYSTKRDER